MGFDIMIDKKGKAWLMEINNSPSLNMNFESGFMDEKTSEPSPIDITIKRPLVTDVLTMAHNFRVDPDYLFGVERFSEAAILD
jgi:tubulin polyglutamylase TTLL11